MVIIGIDPGTSTTGYAVLRKGKKLSVLEYGIIQPSPNLKSSEKLIKIEKEFLKIFKKYKPHYLSIETLFFFKNSKTAMRVSEAKGVIMLTAAKKKMIILEFTPLQVKKTITGYGRANKKQVQGMIKKILHLQKIPKPDDAADALSLAFCASLLLK